MTSHPLSGMGLHDLYQKLQLSMNLHSSQQSGQKYSGDKYKPGTNNCKQVYKFRWDKRDEYKLLKKTNYSISSNAGVCQEVFEGLKPAWMKFAFYPRVHPPIWHNIHSRKDATNIVKVGKNWSMDQLYKIGSQKIIKIITKCKTLRWHTFIRCILLPWFHKHTQSVLHRNSQGWVKENCEKHRIWHKNQDGYGYNKWNVTCILTIP